MSEIELLEQDIAKRQAYVDYKLKDPHPSSYDKKVIKQQEEKIRELRAKLDALKKGETVVPEHVFVSREAVQRGKDAKENPEFPVMRNKGKNITYKSHKHVLESHVVVATGFNVTIR